MLMTLRRWTTPPSFEDEDKTRVAGLLHIILLSLTALVGLLLVMIVLVFHEWQGMLARPISTLLLNVALLMLVRRGFVRIATLVFCLLVWVLISQLLYDEGGVSNPAFAMYMVVIVIAGLLLGGWAAVGFGVLCVATGIALVRAQQLGLLPPGGEAVVTGAQIMGVHGFTFAVLTVLLVITVRSIQATLQRARASECALAERNKSLEAEIARREQAEEAYRTLVEHSIQGLFIYQDGKIVFANPSHLQMIGYSMKELESMTDLYAMVHPEDRAFATGHALEVMNGTLKPMRYELRVLRADGEVRWQEIYLTRTIFRDSPAIQAAAIDITERKQSEQQQLELRLAREKAELLSQFISNISHDLGTPLSVINTSLYLLERITEPHKQKDRLDAIKEQVYLLERLIQDILTSSRLEHAPALDLQTVDLNRLLCNAIQKLRPVAEKKNLAVSFSADAPAAQTLADERELNRAFTNLLENAVKYTPDGGSVSVQTTAETNHQVIHIRDSGIGIAAADLPHIFERFFRASQARSSTIDGTGLGLAIVRQIIDIHGGSIEVTSAPGQGTTFRVLLPAARGGN